MLRIITNMKRCVKSAIDAALCPIKTWLICLPWRVRKGRNVKFQGKTYLRTYSGGTISIGDNVVFNSISRQNLAGLMGPTIVCAADGAKIEIGDSCGFSATVINSKRQIRIGRYVNIGANTKIFDHDFHSLLWNERRPPENKQNVRSRPVVICDDVFIGANVIILKGTKIGARSIVAAGSVVFGLDVPPDSMVKGNPAVITTTSKSNCSLS